MSVIEEAKDMVLNHRDTYQDDNKKMLQDLIKELERYKMVVDIAEKVTHIKGADAKVFNAIHKLKREIRLLKAK